MTVDKSDNQRKYKLVFLGEQSGKKKKERDARVSGIEYWDGKL
jgi:hypothetical protein